MNDHPGCMMPDGADPCPQYATLLAERDRLADRCMLQQQTIREMTQWMTETTARLREVLERARKAFPNEQIDQRANRGSDKRKPRR